MAFRDPWIGYYRGIYRANVAITNIPNVEMDETLKTRLIAENRFLRAYYYFFLVRSYGGVPLITTPLRPEEFLQPRASAEQIYDLIVEDLLEAVAVLPEVYGADEMGRATQGAALGLLARVYLYRGDYPNALTQAEAVINSGRYGLLPDYATVFTDAGENSAESVFEILAVALEEGGGGSQYAQVQGVRGTPNIGWGFNTPSDGLESAYEPGDPRLAATILYPWELLPDGSGLVVYVNPSMQNNRYNQKVFLSPGTPGGQGNGGVNLRRVRYSDVLLIAAEAAFQTVDAAAARQYLNMVRESRAGRPNAHARFHAGGAGRPHRSDGPGNFTAEVNGEERQFRSYWARGVAPGDVRDDGTIAPTAAGGSVPFSPEIAIPALLTMREQYGDHLFSTYGFLDAFNPTLTFDAPVQKGTIDPELGWVDNDYLGIDQGPIFLMIENHRTGFVWDLMKESPYIVRGLCRAGFAGGWLEGRCE